MSLTCYRLWGADECEAAVAKYEVSLIGWVIKKFTTGFVGSAEFSPLAFRAAKKRHCWRREEACASDRVVWVWRMLTSSAVLEQAESVERRNVEREGEGGGTDAALQSHAHRYMGGGLPWASQLNTTSLFLSSVSTGYTMLPGCLLKAGLCRTLVSVGRQAKTTQLSTDPRQRARLWNSLLVSGRDWVRLFPRAKPQADTTYQFKWPVMTPQHRGGRLI